MKTLFKVEIPIEVGSIRPGSYAIVDFVDDGKQSGEMRTVWFESVEAFEQDKDTCLACTAFRAKWPLCKPKALTCAVSSTLS